MRIKKSLITGGVVTAVGLASVIGVGMASAQGNTAGSNGLVDKIAQKFNLNKTDVQGVFDQNKTDQQAAHTAKQKARLDQAVKDGKITQDQEDKIIAKQAELKTQMQAERDALKSKTEAERKAFKDQKRTELEQWAKDNKIPTKFLHPGGQHMGAKN